jgi:hypothetical protein
MNPTLMPDKRYITVKFQKEGIHKFPAAADDPALADVSFLAHPHRHIFHFEVFIEVFHDDREIEFIQFKRWCESVFDDGVMELNYKSCEMLADELAAVIRTKYEFPHRQIIIAIYEDNENGSVSRYD